MDRIIRNVRHQLARAILDLRWALAHGDAMARTHQTAYAPGTAHALSWVEGQRPISGRIARRVVDSRMGGCRRG